MNEHEQFLETAQNFGLLFLIIVGAILIFSAIKDFMKGASEAINPGKEIIRHDVSATAIRNRSVHHVQATAYYTHRRISFWVHVGCVLLLVAAFTLPPYLGVINYYIFRGILYIVNATIGHNPPDWAGIIVVILPPALLAIGTTVLIIYLTLGRRIMNYMDAVNSQSREIRGLTNRMKICAAICLFACWIGTIYSSGFF